MRLIDADALVNHLEEVIKKGYTVYGYACGLTNRMNKDARCRPG